MSNCLANIAVLFSLFLPCDIFAGTSTGTGFFISSDGYVATNNHVIEGMSAYGLRLPSGEVIKAEVVFRDVSNDLAVLKAPNGSYPFVSIVTSSSVKKGQSVFTVGFPLTSLQGVESKVTEGIISSLSGISGQPNTFQITVPIQPGNSGGPLFDLAGNVVGITSATLKASAAIKISGGIPQNVNYAIKSNYLLEMIATNPYISKSISKVVTGKEQHLTALVEKVSAAVVQVYASNNDGDSHRSAIEIVEGGKCGRDSDCPNGMTCRTKPGGDGAMECRMYTPSTTVTEKRSPDMQCGTDADCPYGRHCRSKAWGGTECR